MWDCCSKGFEQQSDVSRQLLVVFNLRGSRLNLTGVFNEFQAKHTFLECALLLL